MGYESACAARGHAPRSDQLKGACVVKPVPKGERHGDADGLPQVDRAVPPQPWHKEHIASLLYALYRLGYHSKATVHGFRATFSTIANEAGFDGDIIEKALAHEQRNQVRAAYHRSEYLEQRRELMQWWADKLHALESGVETITIPAK